MFILDVLAGLLCGFVAVCAFTLHIYSNPKHMLWTNAPEYVRRSFLVVGIMFLWRGVNLVSLSTKGLIMPGHINPEGMLSAVALAYMAGALMVWFVTSAVSYRARLRLEYVEKAVGKNPSLVPLALPPEDVLKVEKALGFWVDGEPPPRVINGRK